MAEKFGSVVFEWVRAPGDPRVADYLGVGEPARLRSRNLFVAEGRLVVARLLADRRWKVRSLLLSPAAVRSLEPALSVVPPDVPILVCDAADFPGLTGYRMHRGCLALVERPPAPSIDELAGGTRLIVALEGVSNADNVGGVFRNAAAFGAGGVLLSPSCCSPLYRKAVRTSMGAALRVPFIHLEDGWSEALGRLRQHGFTLAALVAAPGASVEALDEFSTRPRPAKLAVLVGAEGQGLTVATEAAADYRVHIPMEANVDSLNLSVATGIALEQLTRGERGRGILAARTEP